MAQQSVDHDDRPEGRPTGTHAASDTTCEDYVPLFLREPGSTSDSRWEAQRRAEYVGARHRLRRTFLVGWLILLGVWLVGLVFVLRGVDGDSILGGMAYLLTILLPPGLIALGLHYRSLRGKRRVDDLEEHHEADDEDPFPPDRMVPAGSSAMLVSIVLALLLPVLGITWLVVVSLDEQVSTIEAGVGVALLVAAVAGAVALAGWVRRRQPRETADGLVVGAHGEVLPWTEVGRLPVRLKVSETSRGGRTRTLVLRLPAVGTRGSGDFGLFTGTAGQRARSRHNLHVAARWTTEHHLPPDTGLDAAVHWADGDISLDELEEKVPSIGGGW